MQKALAFLAKNNKTIAAVGLFLGAILAAVNAYTAFIEANAKPENTVE